MHGVSELACDYDSFVSEEFDQFSESLGESLDPVFPPRADSLPSSSESEKSVDSR